MRKKVRKTICPNCGIKLSEADNYCANCGQENHTHKLPLKELAFEFVESLFHFDTKLFHTLKELFSKPGSVTKNFNANKRARYVPPFRLYLFVSAIYFVTLAALQTPTVYVTDSGEVNPESSELVFNPRSGNISEAEKKELQELAKQPVITKEDIRIFLEKHGKKATWINIISAKALIEAQRNNNSEMAGHKILKNISYLMFLLMPLFAFLLYLLYRKKGIYYSEQLVYSVHYHTLAFLLLLGSLLLGELLSGFNLSGIALAACLIFFLLSLKNVFEEPWGKTILKTCLLTIGYLVFFAVSLLAATVLSLI